MAANIYDWSTTAATNSNSDSGIAWPEGQAPSTVNNSARAMMGRVAEFLDDIGGSLAAGGTANGLTVTAASAYAAYADGQIVSFRATANNTGAATLSVNSIGAKALRKMGTTADVALDAGDIVNKGIYVAQYSAALNGAAGAWLLINATRAGKAPTFQDFTATATWTNPGCRVAIFEACGGGGGSGGVDGQGSGSSGSSGGGGSGFYGKTGILDVTISATVTIGAAGAAGAAGNNAGGNGGNTSITIGGVLYVWGGGIGSDGYIANASVAGAAQGGKGGSGSNVSGFSVNGSMGISQSDAGAGQSTGGDGGSGGFGRGGQGAHTIAATALGGEAGQGRGAGAGGAVTNNTSSNVAGSPGTAGFMRVWEFY